MNVCDIVAQPARNDKGRRDRSRRPWRVVGAADQNLTRARTYQKPPLIPNGPPLRG